MCDMLCRVEQSQRLLVYKCVKYPNQRVLQFLRFKAVLNYIHSYNIHLIKLSCILTIIVCFLRRCLFIPRHHFNSCSHRKPESNSSFHVFEYQSNMASVQYTLVHCALSVASFCYNIFENNYRIKFQIFCVQICCRA